MLGSHSKVDAQQSKITKEQFEMTSHTQKIFPRDIVP